MNRKYVTYNIIMAMLAIIVAITLIIQLNEDLSYETRRALVLIDNTIWVIFVIDYFIRLYRSKDKKTFVKKNVIDLISIIPFNSLFIVFRSLNIFRILRIGKVANVAEVIRIIRIVSVSGRLRKNFGEFIRTNNFNYTLVIIFTLILIGSVAISFAEDMYIGDAIWWSIVTVTTVGYGDIFPVTTMGRVIASMLMILGIGLISSLTSTLSTYFINREWNKKQKRIADLHFKQYDKLIREIDKDKYNREEYVEILIEHSIRKLEDFDEMSEEEVKKMCEMLISLKQL